MVHAPSHPGRTRVNNLNISATLGAQEAATGRQSRQPDPGRGPNSSQVYICSRGICKHRLPRRRRAEVSSNHAALSLLESLKGLRCDHGQTWLPGRDKCRLGRSSELFWARGSKQFREGGKQLCWRAAQAVDAGEHRGVCHQPCNCGCNQCSQVCSGCGSFCSLSSMGDKAGEGKGSQRCFRSEDETVAAAAFGISSRGSARSQSTGRAVAAALWQRARVEPHAGQSWRVCKARDAIYLGGWAGRMVQCVGRSASEVHRTRLHCIAIRPQRFGVQQQYGYGLFPSGPGTLCLLGRSRPPVVMFQVGRGYPRFEGE